MEVDPAAISANCLMCGGKLRRATSQPPGRRNLWCLSCRAIRERDANGSANVLFRTVTALATEHTGRDGPRRPRSQSCWMCYAGPSPNQA